MIALKKLIQYQQQILFLFFSEA